MSKGLVTAQSKRIDQAVYKLKKNGLEVLSTRIGRLRPVIEIERPNSMCQGFDITCISNGQTQKMYVAALCGCLVMWGA